MINVIGNKKGTPTETRRERDAISGRLLFEPLQMKEMQSRVAWRREG